MKTINDLSIKAALKLHSIKRQIRKKLTDENGQFAMDNGVATVIIVALGAAILTLLLLYFKGDFSTSVKSKIAAFFSQS